MRILIAGRGFDSPGKHELGLFELDQAKALQRAGHDVRFGAIDTRSLRRLRPWGSREYTIDGIPVFYCAVPIGAWPRGLGERAQRRAAAVIWKHLTADGWRPDVIHAHFGSGFLYEGRRRGIPTVYTEHFSGVNVRDPSDYEISREQTYYALADRLLCVSGILRQRIRENTGAEPRVIGNIVDVDTFTTVPPRERDGHFRFVATGNLVEGKGFDVLLRAFERVKRRDPSVTLTVIGRGDLFRELKNLAVRLNISDSVTFSGWLSRKEIAEIYHVSDAFVLSSRGETFGVAYAEALAAGLPVIATYCGGPEDYVDESNGLLVPVDDELALSQAMERMMAQHARYDGAAISRSIRQRVSPETIASVLQETYHGLLEEKDPSDRQLRVLISGRGFDTPRQHDLGIFELDQAKALSDAGLDVRFAAIDTRSIRRLRPWGSREYLIKGVHVFYCAIPAGAVPRSFGQLMQQRAAKRIRKSILATGWKPDVIHAHFGSGFLNIARADGIPFVYTEHSSAVNRESVPMSELRWENATYPRADRVICVSGSLAERVRQRTGVQAQVIYNMVDTRAFVYNGPPAPAERFRFAATGLLIQRKGFDLLLTALAAVNGKGANAALTVIGGGEERDRLEKLAARLGLDGAVRFTGQLSREQIAEEYAAADAFVLPSRRETFGVVYAEAMAAGLPVIATVCGGPENFVDEKSGILIPVDDLPALEDAMMRMVCDRSRYDSAAIAQYALDSFSPERIAARLAQVYKEIV